MRLLIGVAIHGPTWNRFSHHYHDFSDYFAAVKEFNRLARDARATHAFNARKTSSDERVSLIKREDRKYKAREKIRIFDSDLYVTLDRLCGPCHHRDVLDEDTRRFWRDIPANDWRRSTVFTGLSMKKGNRDEIETVLIDRFLLPDVEVRGLNRDKLDQRLEDQISKKYIPMNQVFINLFTSTSVCDVLP